MIYTWYLCINDVCTAHTHMERTIPKTILSSANNHSFEMNWIKNFFFFFFFFFTDSFTYLFFSFLLSKLNSKRKQIILGNYLSFFVIILNDREGKSKKRCCLLFIFFPPPKKKTKLIELCCFSSLCLYVPIFCFIFPSPFINHYCQ